MTVECLSLCHGIFTSQENSFDGVCRKRRDARLLSVLVFNDATTTETKKKINNTDYRKKNESKTTQ